MLHCWVIGLQKGVTYYRRDEPDIRSSTYILPAMVAASAFEMMLRLPQGDPTFRPYNTPPPLLSFLSFSLSVLTIFIATY
jgi:hypothetical protein